MFLGWFWAGAVLLGTVFAVWTGQGSETAAAVTEGAVMERVGLTAALARLLSPVLGRLFPASRTDRELAGTLSANVTANLLGLGNAATPMGIRAAGRLRDPKNPDRATDALCRLVVMNTASIQLLPTTVAAVRQSAGCATPFDILPCVWVSSVLSVTAGLVAAKVLGRVWRG